MIAVKALERGDGEWVLDVLGNPFSGHKAGKDTHSEFFSPRTRFHEDRYPLPPVAYYHGYDPKTNRPMGEPEYIGRTLKRWVDAAGVWYRVQLDQASDYAKRVWDAAQDLGSYASTGTVEHMSRVAKRTGEILNWPVIELSIWDAVNFPMAAPANWYAVARPVAKARYIKAGLSLPEGESMDEDEIKQLVEAAVKSAVGGVGATVQSLVGDALRTEREAQQAAAQARADEEARIATAVDAALKAERLKLSEARRLPSGDRYMDGQPPAQAHFGDTRKYDNLGAVEQSMMVELLTGAQRRGHSRFGASESAIKAAAIKVAEDKDGEGSEYARRALKMVGIESADMLDAGKSATKANELMHNTQAGYGDEWIGQGYSTAIWEAVRAETAIVQNVMGRGMSIEAKKGEETFTIPLEGADPTWYNVAAATALDATTGRPNATVTASKAATGKAVHSLAKAGARTVYNGELEEDGLIPVVGQLRKQIQTSGAEQIEHAVIDGDTDLTASTNINNIAGTPGATDLFTLWNGFRKSALVTTTSNSRSAGGAFADTDFLETVYLMGPGGKVGSDRRKVDFIIDANVQKKAMQLASVKTRDVFLSATIENGLLMGIWGYNVLTSYFMHFRSAKMMANASGKVSASDASNTLGAILAVRWDQWAMGWRRLVSIETQRWPDADASQIVAMLRCGLVQRDTEGVAETYNVLV